jgi:hypothetical protein
LLLMIQLFCAFSFVECNSWKRKMTLANSMLVSLVI